MGSSSPQRAWERSVRLEPPSVTFRVLAPFAPGCREFFNPSAGLRPRGTTACKFGSGPRGGPVSILAPAAVQGGANLMDVWLAVNLPNSAASRSQSLAADAAMAIAGGQLGQARSLIAQGRVVDPTNPRWDQLSQQVQGRARQRKAQESQRQKAELLSGYLQQAIKHIEVGDYDSAIAAYDTVLSQDPTNAAALSGKAQATGLKQRVELDRKRQEELQQQAAVAAPRSIIESKTEYATPGGPEGPKGFESGGVEVRKATGAPTFPAQVIIEVNPAQRSAWATLLATGQDAQRRKQAHSRQEYRVGKHVRR